MLIVLKITHNHNNYQQSSTYNKHYNHQTLKYEDVINVISIDLLKSCDEEKG